MPARRALRRARPSSANCSGNTSSRRDHFLRVVRIARGLHALVQMAGDAASPARLLDVAERAHELVERRHVGRPPARPRRSSGNAIVAVCTLSMRESCLRSSSRSWLTRSQLVARLGERAHRFLAPDAERFQPLPLILDDRLRRLRWRSSASPSAFSSRASARSRSSPVGRVGSPGFVMVLPSSLAPLETRRLR